MKLSIFLLLFCLTGLTFELSAQTADPANSNSSSIDKAIDLYEADNYKEAVSELNKVIRDDPKSGKAYYYRGMAKMHLKQNGFCKDLEESLKLGYVTTADIYYYGCDTHTK